MEGRQSSKTHPISGERELDHRTRRYCLTRKAVHSKIEIKTVQRERRRGGKKVLGQQKARANQGGRDMPRKVKVRGGGSPLAKKEGEVWEEGHTGKKDYKDYK